jgi:diguanylate cyclase (GGDEF)-like protein/PAS domain S-box-containing protein
VVTGPDGFAVLLLDPVGRVVGWNAGAQRMKGYAASEILGRSFEVFYPPEEAEKGEPARHLAEATAAGHVEYQGWRVRKDGSRFWADVVLTAVFDDDGGLRGFGKVAREATARHEAEQALRDSQQRFRLLADSARNFAIVMLDPAGLVVGWDPSAERMKGYSAAQILGRSFSLFYPPEEAEGGEPARHLAEATAAGHVEYQGWRVRRDGSRFWADVVLTAVFDDVGGLRGFGKVTRDSTTLRQADQALRDSEEHFRVLVDSVRDYAIMMLDPAGLVVSWNAGAAQIHGYRPPEILGRSFDVFYLPEEAEAGEPARHLAEAIAAGKVDYQGWRVRKDGSRFWADVVLTAVFDEATGLRGFSKVSRDISQRRQLEAQLEHQALHDPLTGLANRTLLVQRLEHALVRLSRHPGTVAVLFLDLDRFKPINDSLGHEVGDELLVRTGLLLRAAVRPQDTVARLGGDEFVVLCEDLTSSADLDAVARRVTRAVRVPVRLRHQEVFLSASVGIATTDADGSAMDLLRDADIAMYSAKAQGGGRYAWFDAATRTEVDERLVLTSDLHRAVERGELRVHYQPLVDLPTGEVLAAEALLRWQHPQRGLLAPAAYLGLADEVGVLVDFDAWIMRQACQDAADWQRRLGRPVGVWVNLSGRSLADPGLPGRVAAALDRTRLDPHDVTLEITEGALMRDPAATVVTLAALCGLGVRLAVDDFGTGYSSLAYLQQFPVHVLKVDMSFVSRLDADGQEAAANAAIIGAIMGVADALDLRTVAEGIETTSQLSSVTALGCDLGQGFLLGRPAGRQEVRL